jgi:hypothetical protein
MAESMIMIIIASIGGLIYFMIMQADTNNTIEKDMHSDVLFNEIIQTNPNCPIQINKLELTNPKRLKCPCCYIDFLNKSDKTVTSIKYRFKCYDSFNEAIVPNNLKIVNMSEENAEPNECFGFNKFISFPDMPTVRKVKVDVLKILFSDGSIWDLEEELKKL